MRFDAAAVDKAIDAQLARIPQGKRGAALGVLAEDGSYRVAVATRLRDGWDVVLTIARDPGERPEGAAAVRGSW